VSFVNYNGRLIPDNQYCLTADNRSFRYGDGLFETMLMSSGGVRLGHFHWERMLSGMRLLHLDIPSFFTAEELERQVYAVVTANEFRGSCRVRMTVWREEAGIGVGTGRREGARPGARERIEEGARTGAGANVGYVIQTGPLPAGAAEWNTDGLVIDIFAGGRKACDAYATLKSNNYLLYVLAGLYAKEQRLDDCLVLNSHERLADSTIANLFYIKDHRFYTPPLSEGCVAGVMRRYLLEALPQAGYAVQEQPVSPEELAGADEIFLTNALRGIRWVRSFRDTTYGNRLAIAVHEQIIQKL
jgi:branched-chain amino acid aminotransferase